MRGRCAIGGTHVASDDCKPDRGAEHRDEKQHGDRNPGGGAYTDPLFIARPAVGAGAGCRGYWVGCGSRKGGLRVVPCAGQPRGCTASCDAAAGTKATLSTAVGGRCSAAPIAAHPRALLLNVSADGGVEIAVGRREPGAADGGVGRGVAAAGLGR